MDSYTIDGDGIHVNNFLVYVIFFNLYFGSLGLNAGNLTKN